MRLTALCICGTLLAFLNLSWTTADAGEGVLLGDKGFGPCAATLRPAVPCRPGQDESTCPYLFNLPPLTVHLPKQLRELEKIMKDLQKLKDNVDQLRKMCADCKVSQSERACGRQGEREYEMLIEGKHEHKDERSWMNERNPERIQENDRDLKKECGMDRVKAEKTMEGDGDSDLEKRTTLEEKEREKWGAERESDKGPTKENEKKKTLKEAAEKDGKTQAEGAKGEDNKEPDRDKGKGGKGNSKGDQEDNLENGKERKITTNVKSKQKTEESDHHIWRDKTKATEKKTRTEEDRGHDRIKMSGDHDGHTNREQEQHREERKKEMEKRIKAERNNEKPKQTESIGRAEKEGTIKEGEVEEDREKGKEIRTEEEKTVQSVQRDSDGESASIKAIKGTDFVSISPTPRSIISLTQRPDSMDSDEAITITSSLPSPPLTSSTSHFITDFNEETTITAYRIPSSNTDLWTAGIAKHHDAESAFRTSRPAATATKIPSGGASSQNEVSSTTATSTTANPHQNLHTTTFPGAADRSRWPSKKNISSNTKTVVKPLPGRSPKPGEKHKTGVKPVADQKQKSSKYDRKLDQAPLPDRKTKHDQKHKPSPHKPTPDQTSKPGKDSKQVQVSKPDQRSDSLPTDPPPKHGQDRTANQNLENDQKPKRVQDRTNDQNLENNPESKHSQDRTTDQNLENNQQPQRVQDRTTDQNLENDQKPKRVQDRTTDQNLENDQKPKHDQDRTSNQNLENNQKLKRVQDRTTDQYLENNQKPKRVQDRTPDQNLENDQKPKHIQDRTTDQNLENDQKPKRIQDRTTDHNLENDQKPKHVQDRTTDQNLENDQKPKHIQDRTTDQNLENDQNPKHVQDRTTDQNLENNQKPAHVQDRTTDQNLENDKKSKHVQDRTTDHNLENDQQPKRIPDRTTDQNLENDQKPKHIQDRTTDQNLENDQKPKRVQDRTTDQYLENDQKPKLDEDRTTNQNLENDQKPTRVQDRTTDQNLENNQQPKRVQDRTTDQNLENDQKPKHIQDRTTDQNLENHQKPKRVQDRTTVQNLENDQKPKHDQDRTTDQNLENDQKPKRVQDRTTDQNLENDQKLKRVQDRTTDQYLENDQKPKLDQDRTTDQYLENDQKPKLDQDRTTDQNLEKNQIPKHVQDRTTDQNLETDQKLKRVQDRTTDQNLENDQKPKRVQDRTIDQNLENDQKPKHVQDRTTDQNLENNQITDQSQLPIQKQNGHQKPNPPVQRPPSDQRPATVNTTSSDKEPESDEISVFNQNSKPKKKPFHPFKTNKTDQEQKPDIKSRSEEKTKPDQRSISNQDFTPVQEPESGRSQTISHTTKPNQKSVTELMEHFDQKPSNKPKSIQDSTPGQKLTPDRDNTLADQKPESSKKIPKINQKPKPGQLPNFNQNPPKLVTGQKTKPNVKPKPNQTPQTNNGLKVPRPAQIPNLSLKSVSDQIPGTESNKTSKRWPPPRHRPPTTPTLQPGATPAQRPKQAVQPKPSPKTKTHVDPPQISTTTIDIIQDSHTDMLPTSRPVTAEVSHSPGETEFSPSTMKTISLDPKTSNSLEAGPFPRLHALPEGFTMSPNSRITSDLRPQTAGQLSPIPMTTRPNKVIHGILPSVMPSASPGSTKPNPASNGDSSLRAKILHNVEEVPSPSAQPISIVSSNIRSTTLATSGPEAPLAESSTSSARELRVKINQVAAFPSNSLSQNGRPSDREYNQGGSKPPTLIPSEVTMARRDCSDLFLLGETESGVYLVTPEHHGRSFWVFCDMDRNGGGWTVLQRRQDGSVSFNRTWAEYRAGFGELNGGEFWLGNDMIHLLTRERDMMLFVELEDFDGVMEYAMYDQFKVASERMRYRLTVRGYSGTAGDSLRYGRGYDHNNRWFTTPDRDHDRYPSGNCGAYYSSGWWFDACMAANLNGRYYVGSYKGIRDGIYWGTWHNISTEYYPTNDRQSFKNVRMMIRPKGFTP
ncbi:microtubule-associated protein futsch-like isoform X1 [Thunnus albacares]|uniref:microtubule-associated protein futsch-like isoform X1 n=1 Tax=Thunnus albacares TaxID=8236 RepID=UPI001CF69B2C|nr:microtubule-associated protein futsch-like isoform X1 [Thunnus albacares]